MANRKDSKGKVLRQGESERSDGRYMYRYTDGYGKRQTIYAKTLKELRAKELEAQIDNRDGIDRSGGEKTVGQLCEEYVKQKVYKKDGTRKNDRGTLRRIKKYPLANMKAKSVKSNHVRDFAIELNKKYAAQTCKVTLGLLGEVFRKAVKNNSMRINPVDSEAYQVLVNKLPKQKDGLSDEEFNSLITFTLDRHAWLVPYLIVLRETGLRCGEFLGLSARDIDFDNHLLSVERQLQQIPNQRPFITSPKTKDSEAVIPLTELAELALKEMLDADQEFPSLDGVSDLFVVDPTSLDGLYYPNKFRFELSNLAAEYNEANPDTPLVLTPHVFRHSTTVHFFNKGIDVPYVQRLMRHASPEMTLQVYTKLRNNDLVNKFRG